MKVVFFKIVIFIIAIRACSEPIIDDDVDKDCSRVVSKYVSNINEEVELWSNGIIPYKFSSRFPEEKKQIVLNAMRHWEDLTKAINFIPKQRESKFLLINWVTTKTCESDMGSEKPCILNLSDYCRVPSTYYHELGHVLGLMHEHQRPKSRINGRITFNNAAYDLVNDSLGFHKAQALKSAMYETTTVTFKNTYMTYNELDFDIHSIMGYASKLNNRKGDIYKLLHRYDKNVYQLANCDIILPAKEISDGDVAKVKKLYPKMFRLFNNSGRNLYAKVFLDFSDNPYLLTITPGDSLSFRVGADGKRFILINDYIDVYVTKVLFSGAESNEGLYFEENRITYQSLENSFILASQFIDRNPKDLDLGNVVSKKGLDGKGPMSISMFWSNSIDLTTLDFSPTSLVCEVVDID